MVKIYHLCWNLIFLVLGASLRLILLKQVSQSSSFVGSRIIDMDAHVMRGTFDLSKW